MPKKKKKLIRTNPEQLYHRVGSQRILGPHRRMSGVNVDLVGDCTNVWGHFDSLTGNCTGMIGNCSGLSGNCSLYYGDGTDIEGNLDDIEVTEYTDIATVTEQEQ